MPVATNLFDASGNFDCTNPVPVSAGQGFYLLALGGTPQVPPSITSQPGDSTVLIGQNAGFTGIADGTAPLHYQWLFEGSPISGANATLLTVANVQTTNAGGYSVIITNSAGSITSEVATLTVIPVPATGTPDGYATAGSGTTGGAGGPIVIVDNFADFDFYVDNHTGPFIILVQGTINLGSSNVRIRDNKTIIGIGTNATLVGNLKVFGNNNVIIRNITFTNPSGVGDGDGLTLHECLNVWVDHCTFVDCDDGTLDIAHAADWVTVSWCHFYYTNPANTHRFSNLVGHSDNNAGEDAGKLHVTFHHNWWGQLVHERMPRVRFGRVHCYNNFYNAPGNNYCVRVALECEVLMENNYFKDVDQPWEYFTEAGQTPGRIRSLGDEFENVTGLIPATDTLSAVPNGLNPPPYTPYTLDAASGVPNAVTNNAGAGKGPFAPGLK
jgi:pectate lyase